MKISNFQTLKEDPDIGSKRASNSETIIHAAHVATKATPGYGSKQRMEEENGVKENSSSLKAQKSDGEEEPDIGLKRSSNSETIIHEAPVARKATNEYGSKQTIEEENGVKQKLT